MLVGGLNLLSSLAILRSGRRTAQWCHAPRELSSLREAAERSPSSASFPADQDWTMVITDPVRPRTLYRRTLHPPCVAFSSADGRELFREALLDGNMESYFRLAEQFRTQDDPAFCGLSTLTMVLNSLAVDPGRVWKGPWRWYHESMLDCCAPVETVRKNGITLSTMCCLARCNGLEVELGRPDTRSIEDLREAIEQCSSEDRGKVIVVSYDRRGLKQTGSGHFSPVGGYHKGQDLVLIMDTARFKLPPHWVPLSVLWEAMKTVDRVTGKPRGYMVLQKAHSLTHRVFTAKKGNYKDWPEVAMWVKEMVELASVRGDGSGSGAEFRKATTVAQFVTSLVTLVPPAVKDLLTTFNYSGCQSAQGKAQDGIVLQAIQGTEAYREVTTIGRTSGSDISSSGSDEDSCGKQDGAVADASSSVGPEAAACGCSSRHVLAILTYALLSMLHEHDASGGEGASGGTAGGDHLWRQDPLSLLPKSVADEALHVAGMLAGLMEMEAAETNESAPSGASASG